MKNCWDFNPALDVVGHKVGLIVGDCPEEVGEVSVTLENCVWSIDLGTHNYSAVSTHGKVPSARGGQSVTLVGSKLIMFGGEDRSRHLLNDLHILDLETMTWDEVEASQNSPAPRFDHTTAVHADRYLMVFGVEKSKEGKDSTTSPLVLVPLPVFMDDTTVLLLMEWSEPQTQGDLVTPRAGHAGIAVGETWYIVGGGDNKSGASETVKLNMSKLVWSVVTNVKERDPLASEGLTVSMATVDWESFLVAFGGYNGKYHNEVFVLKCKPSYPKQPRILQSPAAAAAAASVAAAYAVASVTESNKSDISKLEGESINQVPIRKPSLLLPINVDIIAEEKKNLEAKLADVKAENLRLKGNLDELSNIHSDLLMELQSVQGQLQAEISRCSKLELQISEMRKRLESLPSIELELDALRQHKSSWQTELADTQKERSPGLWQWMAGST
ncbi:hypothetical protein Taro_019514 [Colocasia esculenta]|uniref:Acyl-CoA-binding domain-containing protein n=1 Tax=Colocasia esculenta TaxID=4460 RepID=A0A843V5P9_COLES|nr:hypothetical protein [Colocasia esculenta]